MALLENHLEQISLSARSIADLQFPPPRIFMNALLGSHEITTLIRDTEPHERALFSLDPDASDNTMTRKTRRQTTLTRMENGSGSKNSYGFPEPRKQSAVARVLGPDMLHQIQQSSSSAARARVGAGGAVNIEVLLRGAEKLCAVYPVQGAAEKISSLRSRHKQAADSIAHYEEKVLKQQARLDRMHKGTEYERDHGGENTENDEAPEVFEPVYTEDDLVAEEQEILELEAKKKALELRVAGMEKDLGGLLR